jgi:mono/diheme cytochrome c family protein
MRSVKTVLAAISIALFLVAIGAVGLLWSGRLDVSAVNPSSPLVEWAVHSVMQGSVRAHASDIQPPTNLADRAAQGASDFDEMCAQCHGAPGKERGEIGQGLNPRPPSLIEAAPRWTSSELFWIVKNGIRMTGMPAFGPTHDDNRIWAIVSFVQKLPTIRPAPHGERTSPLANDPSHSHKEHDHKHAH